MAARAPRTSPQELYAPRFRPLPLGRVKPEGWLARQLRLQADGLSGHLDEVWPDVRDSRWFGGTAEGWERAPYWLDGFIPLAFVLDDPSLRRRADERVGLILERQQEDGWLGPREMVAFQGASVTPRYDLWGQLLATKALWQYAEATADQRVFASLLKAFRNLDRVIDRRPLHDWGQFRWFEALIALYGLYERDPQPWLVDLAVKLHAQGFHWREFFERWPMTQATPHGQWNYMSHVVNNAMAVKAPALWWRLSGEQADRTAPARMIASLDHCHGTSVGIFTGDECLAGTSPVQGTELCAVVEYAYSLEVLLSVIGDAAFGDRLERIVFNALPATFSPDMWSHQYDQQVNQVSCTVDERRQWTTNRADANIFGLEPDFGCCTANLSQGWPKFAASLWMEGDAGPALMAWAPCRADLTVHGVPVTVRVETDYPFRETAAVTVETRRACRFALQLRIPGWGRGASITVPGGSAQSPKPGTFHAITREWRGATRLTVRLPMKAGLADRPRGAVAVERGPLVYALKVGEDWKRVNADKPNREPPHADWEVRPTTPWNYALSVGKASMGKDVVFTEAPVGLRPFSPEGAPVTAKVRGARVPEWGEANAAAAEVPEGPVAAAGPLEDLTLLPYGCTNIRVAEFPVIKRASAR